MREGVVVGFESSIFPTNESRRQKLGERELRERSSKLIDGEEQGSRRSPARAGRPAGHRSDLNWSGLATLVRPV